MRSRWQSAPSARRGRDSPVLVGKHPRRSAGGESSQGRLGPGDGARAASGWEVAGQLIALDDTHVYWRYDEFINKVPKTGGELEQLPLGVNDPGGPLIVDDERLYAASLSCTAIIRIHKTLGNPEVTPVPDAPETRGGKTVLFLQGDYLYCGSRERIVRTPRAGGSFEVVVVLESQEHRVGVLAIVDDYAYWSHDLNTLGTGKEKLVRARLPLGAHEELFDIGASGPLHFDDIRQMLYVMGSQRVLPVRTYSTKLETSSLLAEEQYMERSLVGDNEYLYWTRTELGDAGEALLGTRAGNDIVRLSKQSPP